VARKKQKRKVAYRDLRTGRFAKKSSWKRSRSRGGTRFKRVAIAERKRQRYERGPRPAKPTAQIIDWLVSFEYASKKRRRGFEADVIVPALSSTPESRILKMAKEFLEKEFGRVLSWEQIDFTIARGPKSSKKSIAQGIRLREVRHPK
jgi:hypothetical protein